MSTVQYGSDAEWQLGTCNSTGIQYEGYSNYVHRCCLAQGQYTLTCINKSRPAGWDEDFIEIQGHRYCNDFMSYRMMQKIKIEGTYSNYNLE